MSVLVLGGTGMLGHGVWRECDAPPDPWATVRDETLGGPAARVLDRHGLLLAQDRTPA